MDEKQLERHLQPLEKKAIKESPFLPSEIIIGEKNLESLGLFAPASKRTAGGGKNISRDQGATFKKDRISRETSREGPKVSIEIDGKQYLAKVTFEGSGKYGLPTGGDDIDRFRALQKITSDLLQQGEFTPEMTVTNGLMREAAGKKWGRFTDGNKAWFWRMHYTSIETAIYHADIQKWIIEPHNIFRVKRIKSDQLETDTRSDEFTIVWEDWYVKNLILKHWRLIDHDLHKKLKTDIAKLLITPLENMFFASNGKPVSKNYTDICQLLYLSPYLYISRIKQQLGPALDELEKNVFLEKWQSSRMQDGKAWKVTFWPGDGFFGFQKKTQKLRKDKEPKQLEPSNESENQPIQQKPKDKSQIVDLSPNQQEIAIYLKEKGVTGYKKLIMESSHTLETMKAIIADCKLKCEKSERGEYQWKEGQSPRQFLFWAFSSPEYKMPEHLEKQMELERIREQSKRREEAQKALEERKRILTEQYNTFVQTEKSRIQESMDRQQWLNLQAKAVDKVKDQNKFLKDMYKDNPGSITIKVFIEKEFEKLLNIPDFETWQKNKTTQIS